MAQRLAREQGKIGVDRYQAQGFKELRLHLIKTDKPLFSIFF
jgi:hypothetical protein